MKFYINQRVNKLLKYFFAVLTADITWPGPDPDPDPDPDGSVLTDDKDCCQSPRFLRLATFSHFLKVAT